VFAGVLKKTSSTIEQLFTINNNNNNSNIREKSTNSTAILSWENLCCLRKQKKNNITIETINKYTLIKSKVLSNATV